MAMLCRLFWHWVRAAASRTFWTAGRSNPIRMAMIAITTNNSIRVNPRRDLTTASFIAWSFLSARRHENVLWLGRRRPKQYERDTERMFAKSQGIASNPHRNRGHLHPNPDEGF